MFITKATVADVPLITPLFNAYRIFYGQTENEKTAAEFLQERLANNESVIFIALSNDKAVGFCQLYPVFSSVSMQRAWLLNDLYVDENSRGQGVATALLKQAKEFGASTNAKWLLLQTAADNFTAQSVYEKDGWQKVTDFFYEFSL